MTEFEMFMRLGFTHITDPQGFDHMAFMVALCAVYQLKDWPKVLVLITAFTIGHSVTLALSTLRFVTVRSELIEFLIPATILITAIGNFFHREARNMLERAPTHYLRYVSALVFGLIHGLGFSNYLKSLLGANASIIQPLFAFNVGLEIGQILIVIVLLFVSMVVVKAFNVRQHDWNLILSGIVAGIAFTLLLQTGNTLFG